MEKIEQKYLQGLKYRFSEAKDVEDETGNVVKQDTPMARDLTPDDVLNWRDGGDFVVLVTADGQKYTVPKAPAEA